MTAALRRRLGLTAVTAVVAGNMLGSGIAFTPGELAAAPTTARAIIVMHAMVSGASFP